MWDARHLLIMVSAASLVPWTAAGLPVAVGLVVAVMVALLSVMASAINVAMCGYCHTH